MAWACGLFNKCYDSMRARSERSLCSRNANGQITDYANLEEPEHKMSNKRGGSENSSALKTMKAD